MEENYLCNLKNGDMVKIITLKSFPSMHWLSSTKLETRSAIRKYWEEE